MGLSDQLRIYPLLTGEADVNAMLDVFWSLSKDYAVITVPILAFLILGARTPILVDTGFRNAQRVAEIQKLGPHRSKPEWDINAQLRRHQVRPEDVKYVILTHLHYDHVGRCEEFPNAQFVLQRNELKEAAAPKAPPGFEIGGKALFYDRLDVTMFADKLWERLVILDGNEEIVPGVRCVLFEDSHTPGSQAVYVETGKGTAIILGDIVRKVELNIGRQVPPGLFYNLRSMQKTLATIKKDGKFFLPTHDYEFYNANPVIPS